jgi:hypothetical protein
MSLGPARTASKVVLAFGAGALAFAGPAGAQTVAANAPNGAAAASRVSEGDCAAFRHYVADEVKAYPGKFSSTFLKSIVRFAKASCSARDADGEIQIITETDEDSISLRTSLKRMGKVDIMGLSGVKGCHRPANGVCPVQTGAAEPRPRVGG